MFATLNEDFDVAVTSRRLLSHYFQRIGDLTGLDFSKLGLPGELDFAVPNKFERVLRKRYLALKNQDIDRIHRQYPEYDLFVSESTHLLGYPKVYDDGSLVIYDIRQAAKP